MKATELRIGNLILHDLIVKEVIAISKDDIVIDGFAGKSDSFQPIQLTEEWIEKFGFVYDKVFDIYVNKSGHELMFVKDGYIEFYLYEYGGPFKCVEYVHQLQNLYFALTGSELEIKW